MEKHAHYFLFFALVCLLIALPLYQVVVSPSSSASVAPISNNGVGNINWASLRGVDYLWGNLGIEGTAPAPSTSFPMMKSYGFNLIRVPISWKAYLANPTQYAGYLQQVASEADANGISVVYVGFAGSGGGGTTGWSYNTQQFFPSSILSGYSDQSTFYSAWWANQVPNGWNEVASQFWQPLVQIVDSHSSTLGYEIMNEPSYGFTSYSQVQPYNQFVYNTIRQAGSSKYVVWCAKDGTDLSSSDMLASAPKGSNIVFDIHYTGTSSGSAIAALESNIGISAVWAGEWGSTVGLTSAEIVSQYQFYKQYGLPSTIWEWNCGTSNWDLLNGSCQPNTVLPLIQQAYNQVYGSGGATSTTSTTTTQSSISSSSSTQTSSISATTSSHSSTSYSSSSSSASFTSTSFSSALSSPSSSSVQTSTSNTSQESSESNTSNNGAFTAPTGTSSSENAGNKLASSPYSLFFARGTAITYSFVSYEIALIGGLPLLVRTARKGIGRGKVSG